jgi:hypothetical protein
MASTDNAAFSISGNSLNIVGVADFENKASYAIRIRVIDSGQSQPSSKKSSSLR